MIKIEITDLKALFEFATKFIPILKSKPLIFLEGDLGSGKTTFVRLLLESLGYNDVVPSPTFNLMNLYNVRDYKICHCDIFRLTSSNELFNLAIEDLIGDNIVIVEWPDLLKKIIHHDYINISFELNNKNERHIVVTTTNPCNLNLLKPIYLDS